ncbi:D-glycero-beta-D-manno-heptose 1,7-bisphosphate 7-phosphatase [Halomonas sp. M20]|uniref:D-glycero-beta-D-manno-heptose 1,7-bisphosphate 7-phosphatase n=1 Tax=Halomonas sp. M20 TaxID=2763264 RepID=UPI001D0B1F7B|nr:D-glycero-beta-D-manno-heptose 1,7-bisphosphate 7-phosphatase [Halomonas sp. M20]
MPTADTKKLIILDRDGVINEDSDCYIKSLEEWKPYPKAIDAIARLTKQGWTIAIATNQSGIARGYFTEHTLSQIHEAMRCQVESAGGHIAQIAYCPHGPQDGCSCRKPQPGLLEQIRCSLGMENLHAAWLVGDSLRDIQAGAAMGCQLVLVRTGKGMIAQEKELPTGTQVYDDLEKFANFLLSA